MKLELGIKEFTEDFKFLAKIDCKCLALFDVSDRIYLKPITERAPVVAQMVKNQPAMQETWIQSLSLKDPLEKGMATHFSILAWRIPWTEEPGGL